MTKNKVIISLSIICTIAAGIFFFSLTEKNDSQRNLFLSEMTGLQSGDFLRVETFSNAQYSTVHEGTVSDSTKISLPKSDDINLEEKYLIFVNITPKDSNQTTDISFIVDRETGLIQTSVSGLNEKAKTSLKINDDIVEDKVPTDWSGQTTLRGVTYLSKSNDTDVCIDIGGYRGGKLSFCHEIDNKALQVQATGGGGVAPFHYELANNWGASLMMITEQLTIAMQHQTSMIGQFLDGKHQLETQRSFQERQAQAHKDYHPSSQMCTVGTIVRNLAQTEGHVKLAAAALNKKMQTRELASGQTTTSRGRQSDKFSRQEQYERHNCNPLDNAEGLEYMCPAAAAPENRNADIDFSQTIGGKATVDFDVNDPNVTDEEQNIYGLLDNLFMARANTYIPPAVANSENLIGPYQDLRSISAMRSVARNSAAHVIAQRVPGPDHENSATPYMRALVQDFGLPDDEITELIGENPSYNAQMDILTSKMFQHPNFITNLYDKPANVERMQASMKAIKSMQDRDISESLKRREMLLSIILELEVRKEQNRHESLILAGDKI